MNTVFLLLWHLDEVYHTGNIDTYEQCLCAGSVLE